MKTQLPNGCSHSKLSVTPSDWQTKKAKVNRLWFIKYRYYHPEYTQPKQVMIKGMNSFKSLIERQAETKRLLDKEIEALKTGFNPFDSGNVSFDSLTLTGALKEALNKVSVSEITKRDLKTALSKFEVSIQTLGWSQLLITDVSRKHVRLILDKSSKSENSFNKNRSYFMILLSVLCELEIVSTNFVRDIKKKKVVKHLRTVLTDEERVLVNNYLLSEHPSFHRFLHIFFHSGARISELMRLKVSDVDLNRQRFKMIIRKGGSYREVWRTIKNIALPFWTELMEGSSKNQFLFSNGLKPGDTQIQPYQINKRWYRLVKQKMNIKADFYSLKHLHTTEVVEMMDAKEAAKHNGHTSTTMVSQVYDIRRKNREQTTIASLDNKFA